MRMRIQARPAQGIRRGGIHHPPVPVEHEVSRFTQTQLTQLVNDPDLSVTLLNDEGDPVNELEDEDDGEDEDLEAALDRPNLGLIRSHEQIIAAAAEAKHPESGDQSLADPAQAEGSGASQSPGDRSEETAETASETEAGDAAASGKDSKKKNDKSTTNRS